MRYFFILLFLASPVFGSCSPEEVIQDIRPNAEWILVGDKYEDLNWLDTVQIKPTRQEIIDAIIACRSDITNRKAQKAQARLDVKNTGLTQGQRLQALLILLDFDR
jgi:hypothetical protein